MLDDENFHRFPPGLQPESELRLRRIEELEVPPHGAAAAGAEQGCATLAQQGSAERIRHHQATFVGDQHSGKVVGNREIEAICEVAVCYPL